MSKLRYACLFSGIGAPLQGAYRVYGKENIEHVFSCEWDKFARQSFEANYEIDPNHFHKDVREMDGTQYQGKVDILIGGSPCQAFSIAGLRNGTDDERGQLIYQYIRIVDEVKAPIIIYENVKGMLSIQNGNTIKEFVQALRDIGYYCHYDVVNTKDYGVPQNRERIFLVGFLDSERYHRFQFAPKQKLEKRLKDVLESEVDEKYYLSHKMIDYLAKKPRSVEPYNGKQESAPCVFAGYYKTPTDGFYINAGVIGMQGGNQEPKIVAMRGRYNEDGSTEQQLEEREDGLTNTITCVQKDNLVQTHRIRKLTPRECLRLQDFPDTFKQVDKEYVKCLFDKIDLDFNSEVIIKENTWEMLKNIINMDVSPMGVIEMQSHSGIVLCTTRDSKNMVMPIMSLNTRTDQKKNANTVIALLGKGSRECAYDTITLKDVMETRCGLMNSQTKKVSVKMDIGHMDMQKSKQKKDINIDVELMLYLKSEENWSKEKLYTILTSIKQMMTNLIYGYSNLNLSMLVHMELLKNVEQNYSKEDLLSLKMGNINFVSDSQMYKQAGNSMSVNILEMIFNQIEKSKTKSIDTLF